MNLLPTGTQLGKLELLEVYQDVLGPKCFSVKNENTQRFMVYWSGDYDVGQCIKWAYISSQLAKHKEQALSKLAVR
ncbi:DUF6575 domain-containing protein [Vibrio splendidus]|uniref:DUF6575 domain-containing protein n=1 Tax=Vibrio splendidus TaxID=29497 RepID=UPI0003018ACC|nr:DUF6575 domain-containing protein [Vibrio splendidus]MDH5937598.1 hypothetical protein [Vibrio splendidus]MDP2590169.1 hypothetical protein [Vibrio splendidus]